MTKLPTAAPFRYSLLTTMQAFAGRHADRTKVLVLTRQEIQRRDVPLHVVFDEGQEIAQLDQVRVAAPDRTRSVEGFAGGGLVVKSPWPLPCTTVDCR